MDERAKRPSRGFNFSARDKGFTNPFLLVAGAVAAFVSGFTGAPTVPSQGQPQMWQAATASLSLPAAPEATSSPTIVNTYITQPVIERIVERVVPDTATTSDAFVTNIQLAAALTSLRSIIPSGFPNNPVMMPVSTYAFAQSQRIDNLSGVTIHNATVDGISGLTDADIPDTITASNYLPLTGGSATSTGFAITSLATSSGAFLAVDPNGTIIATTTPSGGGGSSVGFAWTPTSYGVSTSTTVGFTSGLLSFASSTIGNGTQAGGLTISGGATTTGNAYIAGNLGIGTTTPGSILSVQNVGNFVASATSTLYNGLALGGNLAVAGTATSTFANGIAIAGGCISVNGSCITGGSGNSVGFAWTPTTNFGAVANATSTPIWFQNGLQASSTSQLAAANFSGTVGIGSTTPTASLSVQRSSNDAAFGSAQFMDSSLTTNGLYNFIGVGKGAYNGGQGIFGYNYNSTASAATAFMGVWGATVGTQTLNINQAGSVGIGTTSPVSTLSVNGDTYIAGNATTTGATYFGGPVTFGTSYPNFSLNSDYRLSFGLSNPPTNETGAVVTYGSQSASKNMLFAIAKQGVNTSFFGNDGSSFTLGEEGSNPIIFKNGLDYNASNILGSGTELMRIAAGGGVGIGTNNPLAKLDVNGGLLANASSTIGGGTATGGLTISGGATTTGNAYFAGNVGVGTTSIPATFTVNGMSNADTPTGYHQTWFGPQSLDDPAGVFSNPLYNTANVFAAHHASSTQISFGTLSWSQNSASGNGSIALTGYVVDDHSSGTVVNDQGVHSTVYLNATADTQKAMAYVADLSKYGSGTLTSAYGFYVGDLTYGAGTVSNAYGLYINNTWNASSSWAIYSGATAPSYFGGNVGIGTTSPQAKLSISGGDLLLDRGGNTTGYGSTITIGGARNTSGTDFAAIDFKNYDSNDGAADYVAARISSRDHNSADSGNLRFYTANSTSSLNLAMLIDPSSNVGIGGSEQTPDYQLEIASSTSDGGYFGISSTADESNNGNIFVVNAAGKVGIGTSSPSALLGLQGALGVSSKQLYLAANGKIGLNASSLSTVAQVTLNFTGNSENGLIINDTDASAGTEFIQFDSNSLSTGIGSIQANGSNTGVVYNTTSDSRLKENIVETPYGLADLMKLPVRNFDFKSDPAHITTTGFIAQELYKVFPDAVTTNGDDGEVPLGASSTPWRVDYGRITPLVVKAVQDIAKINSTFRANLVSWFADAGNGITGLFAAVIHTKELCVGEPNNETCITKDQLDALLSGQAASAAATGSSGAGTGNTGGGAPPVMEIQGNNPSYLEIGATYQDLGAIITGPTDADKNLGVQVFVGSTPIEYAVIDTSTSTTYHIYYVATNSYGTATSTRTVIVGAVETPDEHATTLDETTPSEEVATSTQETVTDDTGGSSASDTSVTDTTTSSDNASSTPETGTESQEE